MANPAAAQDVERGNRIAQQWCRGCHQVEPLAKQQKNIPPSFSSVAKMPSTTSLSLAAFLSSSHRNMPDYILTRQEIRDVSAYILSLRSPQQP